MSNYFKTPKLDAWQVNKIVQLLREFGVKGEWVNDDDKTPVDLGELCVKQRSKLDEIVKAIDTDVISAPGTHDKLRLRGWRDGYNDAMLAIRYIIYGRPEAIGATAAVGVTDEVKEQDDN